MPFVFDERESDSPLVEGRIWRTETGDVEQFMSVACTGFSMIVAKQYGRMTLTWRGPETKATLTDCPQDAEFFGLEFKLGTHPTAIPLPALVDGSLDMSDSGGKRFWLNGRYWDFPTYENVDTFLARLACEQVLQCDDIVEGALRDETLALSSRTVQRRFVHATGISHRTLRQIERARGAVTLLRGGATILDVVAQAGYSDQPHMTRAFKRFVGQTPAEIARQTLDLSRGFSDPVDLSASRSTSL